MMRLFVRSGHKCAGALMKNQQRMMSMTPSFHHRSAALFTLPATTPRTTPKTTHPAAPTSMAMRRFMATTAESSIGSSDSPADSLVVETNIPREKRMELIENIPLDHIRNFCIIAHIDHGKSTLADRMLGMTGNITNEQREKAQVLDKLEVERMRGITIKAQTASMVCKRKEVDGTETPYVLNLIDTPGHVDFSYEVNRSLAACQGALLLVDACQGIQAQTIATFYLALEAELDIIPVLTKMDMPHAEPDRVINELVQLLDIDPNDIIQTSAKTGAGVQALFPAIINRIKPPTGDRSNKMRSLVFDSWYETHRGVVCLVKVCDGVVEHGSSICSYHSNKMYEVQEIGVITPDYKPVKKLYAGQVGYIAAGIRNSSEIRLGETFFNAPKKVSEIPSAKREITPLPGFQPAKSMVFASLYPTDSSQSENLKDAIEKLTLNDPSVPVQPEHSTILGGGFRCGFLGVLHMDVFRQRLEHEFGESVIVTAPTVSYLAHIDDKTIVVQAPQDFPEEKATFEEPFVLGTIICSESCLSSILQLCSDHRGIQRDVTYLNSNRVVIRYELPFAEVIRDFYDQLKSISSGYASFDYESIGHQPADLVKIELKINGKYVDALSLICVRNKSVAHAKRIVQRLRETIDRQNFEVIIQAAIGAKIISRERIAPYRKDVLTTKAGKTVGGGDVTRKRKLLEKQKEGKRKMKTIGNVQLGQEAFLVVLK